MLVSLSPYNFLVEKATNGLSTRCSVQEEAVAEVEQSKECLEHPLEFWLWIPVFCLFSMFSWVDVSVSQFLPFGLSVCRILLCHCWVCGAECTGWEQRQHRNT